MEARVKDKYYNYFKNNKKVKNKLPKKLFVEMESPEYREYIKNVEYLKSHKKIKNKVKEELKYKIDRYKYNLAIYNRDIINKKFGDKKYVIGYNKGIYYIYKRDFEFNN